MNKKTVFLLLLVCIAASAVFAGCTAQVGDDTQSAGNAGGKVSEKSSYFDPVTAQVTEKTLPIYMFLPEYVDNISVYYINGVDIPYLSLKDSMNLLADIASVDEKDYLLTYKAEGDKVSVTRENNYSADFDFGKNTIYFTDYDMFRKSPDGPLIEMTAIPDLVAPLFKKDTARSYERYGDDITMDLSRYGIQILRKNNDYYIPLQTFSDVFLSGIQCFSLYNGDAVFILTDMNDAISEVYYSAPQTEKSEELAEFDYNELCFVLDHFYGLKDVHGIKDFDTLFHESANDQLLKSNNQTIVDQTLYRIFNDQLDDLHSGLNAPSFRTDREIFEEEKSNTLRGISGRTLVEKEMEFKTARDKTYPNGIPHYEEVGNTAYITFDHFENIEGLDYYSEPKIGELNDTIRLMQYAYDRITRDGSPIENVVMDLSLNTGGTTFDAVYVTGLFLGEGQMSGTDEMTGALASAHYQVDTNRDHVFDEKDTLAGKGYKFYCIESAVSFSCGNLVPNVFKNSNQVTLIGQTSGGGSCLVQPLSTAGGTSFQISGNMRLSFIKNGAYYDIDRGAEPDVYIKDPYFLYDRKALTDYINNKIK